MKKNYIGFVRDHSGSMSRISKAAARDYNDNISAVKENSNANNQDSIVSVVEADGIVRRVVVNSNANALQPLSESGYRCGGSTPLFDAVGELIEMFKAVPDYNDPEVSFLIIATTDGEENASRKYNAQRLTQEMNSLITTDRWSFVFRVPRNGARALINMGIHEGNILEWDQTTRGVEVAAQATRDAFAQYYTERSAGATRTTKFYADMSNVTSKDVATALKDISSEVMLWPVSANEAGKQIRDFVEARLNGSPLLKGAAFYQLVKTEKEVQDHKLLVVRDKSTNAIYEGAAARQMLGLPRYGTIKLAPDNLGNFDLFIQSTSVNRKVDKGTQVLYWKNVGKAYKEGPSAR